MDWRLFGHEVLIVRLWREIDQWNHMNQGVFWTRKNDEAAGPQKSALTAHSSRW